MSKSSDKKLHIISFDIPHPPDYGGVIDVFFKIKALKKLGYAITLHCWQYGKRQPSQALDKLCSEVIYYKRNRFKNPFTGPLPYIVKTRTSDELVANLLKDRSPILFEGIHTTAPLYFDQVGDRKTVVRNHNIESDYYRLLAEKEQGSFKKTYFRQEAKWLSAYEDVLLKADYVAAISPNDHAGLSQKYNSVYIPVFHPNNDVQIKPGTGGYCLYHGNLTVAENNEAALFLVNEVFSKSSRPLIIAGNRASQQLKDACIDKAHVEIKENMRVEELEELIRNAAINVLPTFQATGIKLKLINALYKGRFCVANNPMVNNSGLESLCEIGDTPEEIIALIEECFEKEYEPCLIDKRREVLQGLFGNEHSAHLLSQLL